MSREVAKKDQEVVEWQLKEKETKAQLHGLEDKVKKSLVLHTSPRLQGSPRLKPRKLLMELPAFRESVRYSLEAVMFHPTCSVLKHRLKELDLADNLEILSRSVVVKMGMIVVVKSQQGRFWSFLEENKWEQPVKKLVCQEMSLNFVRGVLFSYSFSYE